MSSVSGGNICTRETKRTGFILSYFFLSRECQYLSGRNQIELFSFFFISTMFYSLSLSLSLLFPSSSYFVSSCSQYFTVSPYFTFLFVLTQFRFPAPSLPFSSSSSSCTTFFCEFFYSFLFLFLFFFSPFSPLFQVTTLPRVKSSSLGANTRSEFTQRHIDSGES